MNRCLALLKEKSGVEYSIILRGNEVHLVRLSEAVAFLLKMFDEDFR